MTLFSRWENEERVRLGREVEVFAEWWRDQEESIVLHFEKVVLLFPHEWNAFELSKGIPLHKLYVSELSLRLVSLRQHEVENELLSPEDNALNNVQW